MVEPCSITTRNGLLLALAFAVGYIDALSYPGLSRGFTANMTGNTVLPGVALALTLEPLLLFAFTSGWYPAHDTLASETTAAALVMLSALAMGVKSTTVSRLEITVIATTYLIGTLTNLVARLVERAHRESKPFRHSALLPAV
ncbi:MAG: DUF1275 domain-containing protein [Pseudomonadota bacterium]|nr:MAG: DUF1275 domain-containing protein [Pseudomonadota bacterium]